MTGNEPQWYQQPPERQPGIVPLRPLDAGAILGGAIRFVRANPAAVLPPAVATALATMAPQVVVQLSLGSLLHEAHDFETFFNEVIRLASWTALLTLVVVLLVAPPMIATVLATLRPAVLGRRRMRLREAWTAARPRFGSMYALYAATSAIGLVPTLVVFGAALPLWTAGYGAFAVALVLVLYVATPVVTVLLALGPAAVVVEGLGWRAALWRSVELVRGSWWRCIGVQALLVLAMSGAAMAVAIVVTIPLTVIGGLLGGPGAAATVIGARVVSGVVFSAVIGAGLAFIVGGNALLHQDQRLRREGPDAELRSAG